MDSDHKESPKGGHPRSGLLLGDRHTAPPLHILLRDWVSWAFGWCKTRITGCFSSTAVNLRLRRGESHSLLRTQPEREWEFLLRVQDWGESPSYPWASLFPICELGRMTSEEPFRANVLLSYLSRGSSPHLDQEPLNRYWKLPPDALSFWTPDFFFF